MISSIFNDFETSLIDYKNLVIDKIVARKWLFIVVGSISISILCFFVLRSGLTEYKNRAKSTMEEGTAGVNAYSNVDKKVNDVYIDISGAIKNPDLYKLPEGARVMDALKIAGGLSVDGDVAWVAKNLNVARKLKDSDKIYIPFEWEVYESSMSMAELQPNNFPDVVTTVAVSNSNSKLIVNINTATKIQLESLSGIGPAYADRIIQFRPYKNVGELGRIAKIPSSTLSKITELISF